MKPSTQYPPPDFPAVFVEFGWRGVEHFFGARTSINVKWLRQCGEKRLKTLRRRYMRGDHSALNEVTSDTTA